MANLEQSGSMNGVNVDIWKNKDRGINKMNNENASFFSFRITF